eukprot:15446285-Alexandrium_andersonii.AAC.1
MRGQQSGVAWQEARAHFCSPLAPSSSPSTCVLYAHDSRARVRPRLLAGRRLNLASPRLARLLGRPCPGRQRGGPRLRAHRGLREPA